MLNTLNEGLLPVRAQVLDWLARQQQSMQDLLQKVVNIESGSRNEAGVTAVAHALAERLQAAGVPVQFEPVPGYGVLLHAQVNPEGAEAGGAPIILMGHMDTVFPDGTVAKRPYREEAGRAYGPGVADMKSGLVLNVFVAEAFARCGGVGAPRTLSMMRSRVAGEPISSSHEKNRCSGAPRPPQRAKASATNTLSTRPDFMSATPGP